MDLTVGAFLFPEVWQAWNQQTATRELSVLRGFGVNAVCTESESYRDDVIAWAHDLGLRWFGGISCFSDHANNQRLLRERPELWPVLETGERRPQMEWYVGVTPTFDDHNESRLGLATRLAREHDLDGLFLDFIRWPIHWELELRPGARQPLQSSFDPHTVSRFEAESGIRLPRQLSQPAERARWILSQHSAEWSAFRCEIINGFVQEAAARLRAIRGDDFCVGLYALPLPAQELADLAGQSVADLSQWVDLIAPMAYHAIVHRPPEWVGGVLDNLATVGCAQLPVLQVDSAEGAEMGADWGPPVPVREWEQVARLSLGVPGVRGLVAFTGTSLLRDQRGERLRDVLSAKREQE